jgi:transglutaminase-like putative cysteine protease
MTNRRRQGLSAAAATLLATAPLAAIYEEWGWLVHCVVVVIAIASAALLARALRTPLWVQIAAMAGALVMALTWLYPSGQEIVRFLPGAATVEHFGALLGQLPSDIREHSTPVPTLTPLLLVTAAGVGLVAILVDVFVAGLRRPALAGLPMLAIYSVPVAVSFDSVPVLLFAIGAVGYLWLLASDNIERVRRFGRRFTGEGREVATWAPSPLAAAGRRLAVVGVVAAVVLPLGLPGMTNGLIDRFGPGLGGGSGSGSGGSGQMNLFAELHGQLNLDETVDLLRITTDDPAPFYLRVATADQITETGFEPSAPIGRPVGEAPQDLPAAGPGVSYHRHQAEVELTDAFAMFMVPVYPELVSLSGLGTSWRFDANQQVVYSNRSAATDLTYRFDYARPEYDPDALRNVRPLHSEHEIRQRYAEVPEVPEVRALLDQVVNPSGSPYDQVRDILGFFSQDNGFTYDLETGPETDAPAIVDFLEHRVGYCVQYAAAMTWLVRSMDIPARVAFGFTRGSGSGDTRVLTNRNMHAWTEVYFEGFGWVPFDPTPGSRVVGSASTEWAPSPDAPPDSESPGDALDPGEGSGDLPDVGPGAGDDPFPDEDPDFGPALTQPGSNWPWWVLAGTLLALVLLTLPAFQRLALRRRRLSYRPDSALTAPPGPGTVGSADLTAAARRGAHAAWDELVDTMVDLQMPLDLSETPRTTARRLAEHLVADPDASRAVSLLGQAEERARYARNPHVSTGLHATVRTARRALFRQVTPRRRVRAVVLPPSTLLRWRQATADTLAGLVSAANRWTELVSRLSPRRLLRATR